MRVNFLSILFWLLSLPVHAEEISQPAPELAMERYDCKRDLTMLEVRHIGQVVDGSYREWRQFIDPAGVRPGTTCVVTLKPQQGNLSFESARLLLVSAGAIIPH